MAIKGIDVSKWQGDIDWGKVTDSGVEFAFIKLCNCWKDGTITIDPMFTTNIKGALAAGLPVGAYAYMYTRDVQAATLAAQNVVSALAASASLLRLPVACDMEEAAVADTGRDNCTAMAVAWRDVLWSAGMVPSLYVNPNWLKNYINLPLDMSLWLAHYATKPYCASDYWQYTAKGRVPGISGDVDLDWGYVEIADEVPAVSVTYDPQSDLEYLAKAGIIDSPDIWLRILSGEITASVQNHIIPFIAKFRDAVEDKDHILDELQDIIANHDD